MNWGWGRRGGKGQPSKSKLKSVNLTPHQALEDMDVPAKVAILPGAEADLRRRMCVWWWGWGRPSTVVWSLRPWTCQKVAGKLPRGSLSLQSFQEVARQPETGVSEQGDDKCTQTAIEGCIPVTTKSQGLLALALNTMGEGNSKEGKKNGSTIHFEDRKA